ncbi:hypothetical protein Tco_0205882 [Tanacetum coccineum]
MDDQRTMAQLLEAPTAGYEDAIVVPEITADNFELKHDLKNEEKAALIEVLKSHKRAIAWKLSDIKGINPEFCTHKILMEEDYEPTVQHQRRVNPKIHDVIKKEVEKLLDAGLIYPISDSPWVERIEVDRAKVDVIAKLPHPTTVKGVRMFFRHPVLPKKGSIQTSQKYPANDSPA